MAAASRKPARIQRIQHNLMLTRPIVVLAVGVLLPVALLSFLGIVALALWESPKDVVLGVLGVSLAGTAIGGGVIVTVLLGRRARIARLQSDLLGNVSHELKTPLTAIRMYAQTIQSGAVDDDPKSLRTCIDSIARETEWLGAMIERLLAWRAAARDRENLDFVTGSIAGVSTEVAARFGRMLPPVGAEFTISVATTLAVRHDPSAIASVLLNLLTNAFKYTLEPKKIGLSVEDREGSVVIRVEDNGIGIPPAEQKQIFDPFYRVDSSLRGRAAGAGLGLAIADVLVRGHGGMISVESVDGRGSTFTVALPSVEGP